MRAQFIIFFHPAIEVGLQLGDRPVQRFSERHTIELVEHGLVETLANSICLRPLRLGARVVHVFDRQIELILVMLGVAVSPIALFEGAAGLG